MSSLEFFQKTNEWIRFYKYVFVRFLEEIEDSKKAFRNYLTFSKYKKRCFFKKFGFISTNIMLTHWVGGSQNIPKPAYVIYEWYLELHLHPHWQSCPSLSFPIECPAVLWEIRWENINSKYILYFHAIQNNFESYRFIIFWL